MFTRLIDLRDVDVGVGVPHEVDVGRGEILADELPSRVAGLVVPLEATELLVVDKGHASFVAEAVTAHGTVGLGLSLGTSGGPVVEL